MATIHAFPLAEAVHATSAPAAEEIPLRPARRRALLAALAPIAAAEDQGELTTLEAPARRLAQNARAAGVAALARVATDLCETIARGDRAAAAAIRLRLLRLAPALLGPAPCPARPGRKR